MKKRNNPLVLSTVLIIMVGVVAFMNFPKDAFASAPQAPETGKDVQVMDKSEIAKNVSGSVSSKGMAQKAAMGEEVKTGPAIAVTKPAPYKPTPNESATSTQWYSSETPKEFPKKK